MSDHAPGGRKSQKWAVLIGIEHYDSPLSAEDYEARYDESGNEIRYTNLYGCVNDVLAIEEYLVDTINIEPAKIKKLIAPVPGRRYLSELPRRYLEPTYDNIMNALRVPDGAGKGDFIYIHFSGHGGRATTIFDKTQKNSDLDEALVPIDIVRGGKYLRDLELGMLLQDLEDAGLTVTVVLDCCHSGGAVRGRDDPHLEVSRGVVDVYLSEGGEGGRDRPRDMHRIQSFGRYIMSPWRRTPSGIVVLAACLETQLAREKIKNSHTYGLLTCCLLEALSNAPRDLSSQALFQQIHASVQNSNKDQMPFLVGNEDRFFFSKTLRPKFYTPSVTNHSVDISRSRIDRFVALGAGRLHGVKDRALYAILPVGFDFAQGFQETDVLARVRVQRVSTGDCRAVVEAMDDARWRQIVVGCPAVLQELPSSDKFTVAFEDAAKARDTAWRDVLEQDWHRHKEQQTWLSLDKCDSSEAGFVVEVDANDDLKIHRAPGDFTTTPWDTTPPALPWTASTSMPELIRRLEHIARFTVIKNLGVLPGTPPSRPLVSVRVDNATADKKGDRGQSVPPAQLTVRTSEMYDQYYEVEEDTGFRITVRNESSRPLGCVILDCGSDFSVDRVYPIDAQFHTLEAGKEMAATLIMRIADNQRESARDGARVFDTLKVIVCTPALVMDSLRLPGLFDDSLPGRAGRRTRPLEGLEKLLRDLDMNRLGYAVRDDDAGYHDWGTTDIRLRIWPSGGYQRPVQLPVMAKPSRTEISRLLVIDWWYLARLVVFPLLSSVFLMIARVVQS